VLRLTEGSVLVLKQAGLAHNLPWLQRKNVMATQRQKGEESSQREL
jgi:hypothetical protein